LEASDALRQALMYCLACEDDIVYAGNNELERQLREKTCVEAWKRLEKLIGSISKS